MKASNYPFSLFDYTKKTVLITGATRGIGRALAEGFLSAGAKVYGTGKSESSAKGLQDALAEIEARACDVCDTKGISQLIKEIVEKNGRLDLLINNAGIASQTPASAFKESEMDAILNTNLKGAFFASQAYYKLQRKSGGGVIINIASILGMVGYPLSSIYSASKGGLIQLTRSLAMEWSKSGFRVNAICPGFTDTDMTEPLKKRESVLESALEGIPLRRLARPEDMLGAALYLGGEASSYVTGQCLVVDGGIVAQ